METPLCGCGCGRPAPLATKTSTKQGTVKGQPQRFISGHHQSKRLDLKAGERYGRLVVLQDRPPTGRTVRCLCDCGNETTPWAVHVAKGKTKSCGCGKVVHGHRPGGKRDRTYSTWQSMKIRCTNPAAPDYARYGGRGITVCQRWLDSFVNFLADMGERPEGRTLDRIDNSGNYEPDNCRWATPFEQIHNRGRNKPE